MAEITRSTGASLCSTNPPPSIFCKFTAGEDLPACSQITVKSDGFAWRAAAADFVIGMNAVAASSGEAVGVTRDQRYFYASTIVPGTKYYPSGTVAGGLADAATSGNAVVCIGLSDGRVQQV